MHVVTFADKENVYLHALAASASFYNSGHPLLVLGLSRARSPPASDHSARWRRASRVIKGVRALPTCYMYIGMPHAMLLVLFAATLRHSALPQLTSHDRDTCH